MVMTEEPTADDVVRWLKPFVLPGEVYELRILDCVDNPQYPPFTMFGYFDSDHLNDLAEAALDWTPKAVGVYVTMNPVVPDLLARANNRLIRATRGTKSTSDGDIVARRRLTIDFDPDRPAGISATDAEKVLASQVAWMVRQDFHALGWPEPVEADSGNGYHLNYAVNLPADDGGLVERFLQALSAKYTTPTVKVDTSLFNPSRIIKLYGTWSRKGDSIPSRPRRLSRVDSAPPCLTTVDCALIEAFIRENPPPTPAGARPEKSKPLPGRAVTTGGPTRSGEIPDVDLRPGDDFEDRADWMNDVGLGPAGWTPDAELSNGEIRLARPGKNGGTSATIGHNQGLHVFTDSNDAAPFDAGQNYSKFEAYTLLNHGGDYKASVPALVQLGYGRYVDNDGSVKQNPPPPGWKRKAKTKPKSDPEPTQTDVLLEIATIATLFRDDANVTYAAVPVSGHVEVHAINSTSFGQWLLREYRARKKGKMPSAEALALARAGLDAVAAAEPIEQVFLRVGEANGKVYIDMGDPDWRAIEIDSAGWRIIDKHPVRFRRSDGMKPFSSPIRGGNLKDLRSFLNIPDEEFCLMVGWLASCLLPQGPYPILALIGEQGCGKSTLADIAKRLVDPQKVKPEPSVIYSS